MAWKDTTIIALAAVVVYNCSEMKKLEAKIAAVEDFADAIQHDLKGKVEDVDSRLGDVEYRLE